LRRAAVAVISTSEQDAKENELRLYPVVPQLVGRETLKKMDVVQMGAG
jgi:hypothetical protein